MKTRNNLVICAIVIFHLVALGSASAQIWKVANFATASWSSVASSTNGVRLVAVASSGQIFTSTNAGATWITNTAPLTNWTGVASSADGSRLVAVNNAGGIYTNSGISWTLSFSLTSPFPANWQCVASSDNGSNLVAAGIQLISGVIYYSTNAGASWAKAAAGNFNLKSIAFAGNGTNLFAAGSALITSTNAGASWTTLPSAPAINYLVCSTNGLKLAGFASTGNSPIYTSTNAGASWLTNLIGQSSPWTSLTTSANGTRLAAGTVSSGIYHSANSGANWQLSDAGGLNWTSVASSADGTALVATGTNLIFVGKTPLPVLSLAITGTNVSVFWPTNVAGYGLFLFYKTDLTNSLWQFVAPAPVITNNLYRVTQPATNKQIFFNLLRAA